MNAHATFTVRPADRIEAAEAALRATAERRGHKVGDDLATLDQMAIILAKALADAGKLHRSLNGARLVRRDLREVTGDYDAQWIGESLREAMDLSPEGHAVLAARMAYEISLTDQVAAGVA